MEREAELVMESWDSAMSENRGLRDGLSPLHLESDMKPRPLDDDGTDISLKDWQLGLRSYSVGRESMAASSFRPLKGSVRTRFSLIEPKVDENTHPQRLLSPERFETAPTTPRSPRGGARSPPASPTRLESSNCGDSSLDKLVFSNGDDNHLHKVNEVSGIASPGVTVGEIGLEDAKSDNFRSRLGAENSLRVSFTDESEHSRSRSLPEIQDGPLLKSTTTEALTDCSESGTVPIRREKPIALGVGPRDGLIIGDKPRGSPLPLPESLHQSCGMSASGERGSQFRHFSLQGRRSLDSIGEGSNDDSSSNLVSGPLATSGRHDKSTSNPDSPSFLLRCNARRQHEGKADVDCNEDMKVGMLCGGPFSDTKISGDFVRLLSKLCRLSVPLTKQSVIKASQEKGREVVGSNSIPPQVFSWETQNSSVPCEDYVIIGRQNSLKLLCERCSSGSTPAYNVHKPRKIRDHEHHQHFYKPISKTLDQKLRS